MTQTQRRAKKNFKLTIEYDGTLYHGWQRQKDKRTIQGEVEKALCLMLKTGITLTGSGRTDSGVHAFGQVANFHAETDLLPEAFQNGLNSLLPEDIVIKDCIQVDDAFNARYDAESKTYHYRILNQSLPCAVYRQYAWFIKRKLDFNAMRAALPHITGTHDFKAFEGAGSPRSHTTRRVMKADLVKEKDGYMVFEVKANGFLRYMVRNIAGTLVDVGLGKIDSDKFRDILLSKDRNLAGATAPPHGLFLMHVAY